MDCAKIGALIRRLRQEQNLTQQQLADKLCISNKTVSKWERGLGCPDVSLLNELSAAFGVELSGLLAGELVSAEVLAGDLKKMRFFVCPGCGNLLMSMGEGRITCCGKQLSPQTPRKPDDAHALNIELVDNEYYLEAAHEMSKEHYIAFVALLSSDGLILRKLYPEWGLSVRLPRVARGELIWYCTKDGLFQQPVYYKKIAAQTKSER